MRIRGALFGYQGYLGPLLIYHYLSYSRAFRQLLDLGHYLTEQSQVAGCLSNLQVGNLRRIASQKQRDSVCNMVKRWDNDLGGSYESFT